MTACVMCGLRARVEGPMGQAMDYSVPAVPDGDRVLRQAAAQADALLTATLERMLGAIAGLAEATTLLVTRVERLEARAEPVVHVRDAHGFDPALIEQLAVDAATLSAELARDGWAALRLDAARRCEDVEEGRA